MNTQYFKYAIEIERTRSITHAAENLYMGQPNLSRAMKELEDSLGFSIFERTAKGVVPTEKGEEFLMYAKNIVMQLENMERLSYATNENLQTLNVSVPRSSYISCAFSDMVKGLDYDGMIDMNFKETNAMQSIFGVCEGKHNFAIIRYRMENESYFKDFLDEKKLSYETIWEFERIILTSAENKYVKNGIISSDDLGKCIELVHGDTIIPYHQQGVKSGGRDKIKKIRLYERGNQIELLSEVPESYIWTSPVPKKHLDKYSLISVKSDKPGKLYRDVLVYQNNYKFTELDRKFIDNVYKNKNELSLG